jgi:hypothetical protein
VQTLDPRTQEQGPELKLRGVSLPGRRKGLHQTTRNLVWGRRQQFGRCGLRWKLPTPPDQGRGGAVDPGEGLGLQAHWANVELTQRRAVLFLG